MGLSGFREGKSGRLIRGASWVIVDAGLVGWLSFAAGGFGGGCGYYGAGLI